MEKKNPFDQARDTGLAMSLLLLIFIYWSNYVRLLPIAILVLLLSMVWPTAFRPLSKIWFGLSYAISTVMSKFILTLLFFGIVTPLGVLRRWFGADPMQMKKFKNGNRSVLQVRDKAIEPKDLEQPY